MINNHTEENDWVEPMIAETYAHAPDLGEEHIARMVRKIVAAVPLSPVILLVRRPLFQALGVASILLCAAAGFFNGMDATAAELETVELAALGLEQLFADLNMEGVL